jgi:serine/threonine protein kinase
LSRVHAGASSSSENETSSNVSGVDRRLRTVPGSFAVGETVDSGAGTTLVIREVLGRGSFGTTYACERPDLGDDVALKVLTLREMRDWKALQLFEREAKTLKALSHPAIPEYVDYFEVDSAEDVKFCLVQKIAPGSSLQSLVDNGWRPTEPEIVSVAKQLLEVLAYLSSLRPPVVHRDVKPGNLLFDKETGKLSLVDFGATAEAAMTAAVAEERGNFQMGSTMIGTFGYAAPEQMMGGTTVVSDLFSAGAVLLFLLSGRAPSTMPSSRLKIDFRGVVTVKDPKLEALVTRLLEPTPEDRFADASEALDVLLGRKGISGGFEEDDASGAKPFSRARSTPMLMPGILSGDLYDFQIPASAARYRRKRVRKPSGTRVIVERAGNTKFVLAIPPAGITVGSAALGGFALAWNSFVAFWTVSALASGGGLLMAAFSIPFWFAGKQVVSVAFAEIFEATRVELDASFGAYSVTTTATGFASSEKKGDLLDVRGAVITVDSVTNDRPDYALRLEIGAEPVTFGRGLQEVELEYVAGEINDFLETSRSLSLPS